MKIKKINEAVDWSKAMENNNHNMDRIKRLKNLQTDIPPVMGDALEDNEKFDKNSKEVFTKLSKDAESVTPKNPSTGKKITRKPYTEKLTLDESLFIESTDLEEDYDRPIATMGLTNNSGIAIYDLNDDEVTFAFVTGDTDIVKETASIEYDCEDEDCRPYFSVGDIKYYLDEFMRTNFMESKSTDKKKHLCIEECSSKKKEDEELTEAEQEGNSLWQAYGEEEDEEEEDTVFDFVDARLFGTNKSGLDPNSSNFKKVSNFLPDITIPKAGGRGRYNFSYFYPSGTEYLSGSEQAGNYSRRFPMFDDGIGVYLLDEKEAVLAEAVANELKFDFRVDPVKSDKGFKYVAKIFIPESIMEMPIEEYLESIGKSLSQYKKSTRKAGRPRKQ